MTRWEKMMVFYGSHHRSPLNVAAHVVGVPIILTGALIPLALIEVGLPGLRLTGAWIAAIALGETYFKLDRGFAYGSVVLLGGALAGAHSAAALPPSRALAIAAWCFFGGYVLQFIAHGVEGKRPALFENALMAQVTAPLFVVAEIYKLLGLRRDVFERVESEIRRRESAPADSAPAAG